MGYFFHKIWLFNSNFSEENEISKKKKKNQNLFKWKQNKMENVDKGNDE